MSFASRININENVIEEVEKLLAEAMKCSKAMDFVPRPGIPSLSYIRNQLAAIVLRVIRNDKIYDICKVNAANNFRSAIEIASLGI